MIDFGNKLAGFDFLFLHKNLSFLITISNFTKTINWMKCF